MQDIAQTDKELLHSITDLTCRLIDLPSREDHTIAVASALRMIQHHVEHASHFHVAFHEKDGVPSMVITPEGINRPEIMLLAHADVIKHSSPEVYRAEQANGRIIGPGAGDMKSQLAILAELFRNIHTQHQSPSLGLMVTTDEETGGEAGVGYLFGEHIVDCGLVINPDGGSLNEVTIMEKGALHLTLHSKGAACHAARPWKGDNALTKLMAKLNALQDSFIELQNDANGWHPTCSITAIDTDNHAINRIPPYASATVDIRFPPPYRLGEIRKRIEDILGPDIKIDTSMNAEPVELDPDPLFMACCEEVCGRAPCQVRDSGASDSRYIAERGIPVIMSRPLVGNLHSQNEWVDIDSMLKFYRICERFVYQKLGLQASSPR